MTGDENARLRAELMSADPSVQILAARRCARAKPAELVHELIALGCSSNAAVRAAAYWALDQMSPSAAIPQLVEGLEDTDFVARSNAGWALVHIGPEVLPYVEATAAHSADADAREMAGLVLAHVADDGSAAMSTPLRSAASIARTDGVVAASVHAMNNELEVLIPLVEALASQLSTHADVEASETAGELLEFVVRIRASIAAFNGAFCSFDLSKPDSKAARIEVIDWASTLERQLRVIDGYSELLLARPDVFTLETQTDLALVRRCVKGTFDGLVRVCARLPRAAR